MFQSPPTRYKSSTLVSWDDEIPKIWKVIQNSMDFSLSDCNFCSAHGPVHADTQVAVDVSFRLHVLPRNVFETKPRKRKPVKHQFFQTHVLFLWFWDVLFNAMQKPFRNRSCVTSLAVLQFGCCVNPV